MVMRTKDLSVKMWDTEKILTGGYCYNQWKLKFLHLFVYTVHIKHVDQKSSKQKICHYLNFVCLFLLQDLSLGCISLFVIPFSSMNNGVNILHLILKFYLLSSFISKRYFVSNCQTRLIRTAYAHLRRQVLEFK